MSTKRSHILKQTYSWKLQVCLSMCDLLVDTRYQRVKTSSIQSKFKSFCYLKEHQFVFFFQRKSVRAKEFWFASHGIIESSDLFVCCSRCLDNTLLLLISALCFVKRVLKKSPFPLKSAMNLFPWKRGCIKGIFFFKNVFLILTSTP